MDKDTLTEFIDYCEHYFVHKNNNHTDKADYIYIYEKYGHEFIHSLPIEHKTTTGGSRYTVILGTRWIHSITDAAYRGVGNQPWFYILGQRVSLDEWLPYCALSPEDITLFKLKYA
jgi:hypothetical protein